MTQRSRNVLIIVFLAVLIAGGAIGIYFVSRVQTSLVLPSGQMAKDVEGRDTVIPLSLAQQLLPGGDTDIDWLSGCSLNGFDPTNRSNWEAKKGGQITINFTCTNTDPSTAHKLEVRAFDLRAYVYQLPPNEACLDQGDKGQFQEWPKVPSDPGYYNWNTLQLWVGNWAQANGADCSGLPAGKSNIQELGWPDSPDSKQTIDVPAGQTAINFTTTHNFSECDWYQYDVLLLDALNQDHEFGVGSFRRSYGDQIQCGIVGPTNEASLEVRAYMDDNHDFEYGPQTSEGAPFFQKKIKITDTATGQEIDYAAEDCGGVQDTNQLGGAGRTICPKLDAGKTYTVELVDLLPNTTGPIKETHNTNGINPVDITLVGDPAKDIVDFGFQPGLQGVGSLLVRVYEEKTPADDEYTNNSGEGAVFANTPVTITDSTGKRINPVTPPNPNCPAVTGGAGRISCTGLTAGNYTIDVDPDITTHDGPDPEAHNPQGEDPYTVAVTVNKETIADFQYLPRIVNPQLSCTLGAQPSQGMIPLNVTFTATVQPAGTTVQKYDWVFGDGQTASGTQNTQQHTYTQQGNYTASVTLTTQAGETVSCTTIIQAKLVQPQGVNCTLAANPSSGISPLDTTLTVTVAPAGTTVTSYTFEFGDGSQAVTQTGASIQHTYTGKNTYTAKATVNDSTGAIATCTTPVEVDQILQPGFCQIDVVDYLDLNKNLQQDPGIVGYIDPGMDGASVTIQRQGGQPQTKITAPVPLLINRYGEASFTSIPCGTYTVSIDETSTVTVGGTTQSYILNRLQRLTPAGTSTQVTVGTGQSAVRVGFGYTPRVIQAFLCDIDKTVADTTAADEGTPDDPKVSNSSAGETLTYTIDWDCSGFPTVPPLSQTVTFTLTDDFYDPLLTIVPGSITGGGVYNQSQGIITWTITGATNVDQGSVSFQATIASNLAPGTYVLPNYAVAVAGDGTILDQDQTITNVTVTEGPDEPDVEVIKYATDLNGGQVLPGDILQYYVVVWNNGNKPLNNVTVTENVQPNVNSFKVISIPTGATDNSTPTGGSNGTGYLDVTGIALPKRGDVGTITYQVTVNAGVPSGTQLVNFVTATTDGDQDTDDETVVVGQVLPTPPPAPPAGPGPTAGVNGQTAVPPLLGPRAYVPPLSSAGPTASPETGVGAVLWGLLASLIVVFSLGGYLIVRRRSQALAE